MQILIVKTSSMGDIIHTLPAVTDLVNAKKNISIDWAVEAAFAEIPRMNASINKVIPVQLRNLRKHPLQTIRQGELRDFYQNIKKKTYDIILDAQGLIKSALLTRLAKGTHLGLDANSAREPLASLLYDKKFYIPKNQHAIHRLRQLFAKAFDYTVPDGPIHYGLNREEFSLPAQLSLSEKYLVFLHGTSWPSKHWPQSYWVTLTEKAIAAGFSVVLPWATDAEYANASEISQGLSNASILPHLSLTELAAVLAHATGVVSVDSGLGHLACALNVPLVGLYGPTDYRLTGMLGPFTAIVCPSTIDIELNVDCAPCLQAQCTYTKPAVTSPACFATVTPQLVLDNLITLISKKLQTGMLNEL